MVDAYGASTITANLATFSTQYALPSCTTANGCFTKVNQTGGSTLPKSTAGWALEQSLDVEWAHAMAPKARVLLVEATSAQFPTLMAAVRTAASRAKYVSMSWGGTEFSTETTYNATFQAPGVSFFAAAGDTASAVIFPSVSPDVVSVGGTTLQVKTRTWQSESAWSTAGGGCSRYETATTAQLSYLTVEHRTTLCAGKRATPDISLDANPSTGVAVYDTQRVTGLSGWIEVGGTSASTVMIAAHAAETTRQVTASYVYGSAIDVYDVTSGSNGHSCVTGYDLCTGVGSWNTAVGTTGPTPTTTSSSTGGGTTPPASSTLTVSVSAGTTVTHGPWGHTPITVAVTRGTPAVGVGGATVLLDIFHTTCSGTPATSGSGTTGTNGSVTFTFKSSGGTYCAEAIATSGSATGTGTTTFTG